MFVYTDQNTVSGKIIQIVQTEYISEKAFAQQCIYILPFSHSLLNQRINYP